MSARIEDNLVYIGEFDEQMEDVLSLELVKTIQEQERLADGRIDFYINSYGGLADVAFHVVELMEYAKTQGVTIRTIVTSAAYSCGSIVAVAGTHGERYISENGQHLAHYGRIGSVNETPTQTQRNSKRSLDFFNQIYKHYEKHCDIPDLETKISDDGWFISAKEAKKWKMADHYMNRLRVNP